MKKTLSVLVMIGLLAATMAVPAEAGKKKKKKVAPVPVKVERVVEVAYDHPGIGAAPVGGYPAGFPAAATEIATGPEDKYFKVEVLDASGQKVWGFISQGDLDGNGVNDDGYGDFCGSHDAPQPVAAPGTPILGIYAYSGTCGPDYGGTPSVMTQGTIKVTFSNMP